MIKFDCYSTVTDLKMVSLGGMYMFISAFKNIGRVIKIVAEVLFWVGIVASLIFGILVGTIEEDNTVFIGVLLMICGSISSWVTSLLVYGFGQLVENSDTLVQKESQAPQLPQVPQPPQPRFCTGCGTRVEKGMLFCGECGTKVDEN